MNPNRTKLSHLRRLFTAASAVAFGAAGWAQPAPSTSSSPGGEELIELSPFEVDASQDVGYYAENTLAGSRMRTNVADLGASITVVTMQQLEDTASTDINDVFRYEANTEGSATYTPSVQSLRNDGVVDVNAGYTHGGDGRPQTNANANRVRGLGVPGSSQNYYPSISSVPFDSYNVQSIEISRGPNSMLFGMGSPAGIVNQTTAQAALDQDALSVGLRADNTGSMRGSFSFNKGLIPDSLAIMGAALYDDRRFEREPAYDKTRRVYGALTFKPFPKTTIRANIEEYNNDSRRANSLTPRDSVTEWRLAGSPTFDPTTGVITRNGQNAGVLALRSGSPRMDQTRAYVESLPDYNPALWNAERTQYNGVNIFGAGALNDTRSPLYTPGLGLSTTSRPIQTIDRGEVANYFYWQGERYRQAYGTPTDPAASAPLYPAAEADIFADPVDAAAYDTARAQSNFWTAQDNGVGSYRYPGVNDRSIYDWEKINILQMNFGEAENTTANIEFEQEILDNLNFSAGWFRQDYTSITNYTVSQLNVATLFVDTNTKLPDGTPNPYFGLPFVEDFDPDQFVNTEINDNYRAMLAYTPDFTGNEGWTKWLGRHQLLGLRTYTNSLTSFIRQRMFYTDSDQVEDGIILWQANPNNNADGSPTGWNRQARSVRRLYYLASPGDPTDGSVTHASGENQAAKGYSGEVRVWNFDTNTWHPLGLTSEFIDMDASTSRRERQVDSLSFGITSHLWNDRIVFTYGLRRDEYKARGTTTGAILDEQDNVVAPGMTNAEKWVDGVFQRETVFDRWNRWDRLSGNTSTIGAVVRPFDNWNSVENKANDGSAWWQFVRSLGFSYNKSDNFDPPSGAQVDAFGDPLPKPTGEGEDYGFQFSLFDNKLFARFNWFEATNQDERTNPGTSISRLVGNVDTDQFRNWARTIALINMGFDPREDTFGQNLTSTEEQSVQDASAEIWGLPYDYYGDLPGTIFATRDAVAEGVEAQITYNPMRNWSMKFTFGKQDTKYSNVLKEFDDWFAERNPVWTGARGADYLLPQYQQFVTYTRINGREVNLTDFWNSYGYTGNAFLGHPDGIESQQDYYDEIVTPQYNIARELEGQSSPGQRKYRWSYLTNYQFQEGALQGFSVGGAARWEDKAVIGYFGRPNVGSTELTLADTTRPIFDDANTYIDLWVGYSTKLWEDKVRMKLQLNVINAFEDGGLQVVGVNYDGSPNAYRIIDPRQLVLTAKFDF